MQHQPTEISDIHLIEDFTHNQDNTFLVLLSPRYFIGNSQNPSNTTVKNGNLPGFSDQYDEP